MLRKPRRWLGYTIELNDLLPDYEKILDRFERTDIPLDDVFGSGSITQQHPPRLLIAFGPAVAPTRLGEVLDLLDGIGQPFLIIHDDPPHNKVIYIGALNLDHQPFVRFSDELRALIDTPDATAADLVAAVGKAPKIQPIRRGESSSNAGDAQ